MIKHIYIPRLRLFFLTSMLVFVACRENKVIPHKNGFTNSQQEKAEIEKLVNDAIDQVVHMKKNNLKYINLMDVSIITYPRRPIDVQYKMEQEVLSKYNFRSDIFSDSSNVN